MLWGTRGRLDLQAEETRRQPWNTTRRGFCLFFGLCKGDAVRRVAERLEKRGSNSKIDLRCKNLDGHDGEGQGRSEKTELM